MVCRFLCFLFYDILLLHFLHTPKSIAQATLISRPRNTFVSINEQAVRRASPTAKRQLQNAPQASRTSSQMPIIYGVVPMSCFDFAYSYFTAYRRIEKRQNPLKSSAVIPNIIMSILFFCALFLRAIFL